METGPDVVTLEPCKREDAELLFKWRNDARIISQSTLKKTVTWDEHIDWLSSCLDDADQHRIFIIRDSDESCGTVRFDRQGATTAHVSVLLEPGREGRGIGVAALVQATQAIFGVWRELGEVRAYVLDKNKRACRAFEKAGYSQAENSDLAEHALFLSVRSAHIQ